MAVYIDYTNAREQAKKLELVHLDCDAVVSKLRTAANNVPNHWTGAAADSYVVGLESQMSQIQAIGENAQVIANQIYQVVAKFEEAEAKIQSSVESGVY